MVARKAFVFGAALVVAAVIGGAALYDRDAGVEVATCGTCQDPKPPSPFPLLADERHALLADADTIGVQLVAFTVDGIDWNPVVENLRAPHPTRPGKCNSCHGGYDICLPPCRIVQRE